MFLVYTFLVQCLYHLWEALRDLRSDKRKHKVFYSRIRNKINLLSSFPGKVTHLHFGITLSSSSDIVGYYSL
jgi:hypothetical protein